MKGKNPPTISVFKACFFCVFRKTVFALFPILLQTGENQHVTNEHCIPAARLVALTLQTVTAMTTF